MPIRRSRNIVGAGPLTVGKRKPVEVWEDQVFAEAVMFTTVRFLGRGKHERYEYPVSKFLDALSFARYKRDPSEGKPFALYVVSGAGRSVCLERNKDEHWKALWDQHHKLR